MNLAQYLVDLLQKNDRDTFTFFEELPHISDAAKVALPQLTADLKILNTEFESVEKSIDEVKSTTKSDKFQKKMKVSLMFLLFLPLFLIRYQYSLFSFTPLLSSLLHFLEILGGCQRRSRRNEQETQRGFRTL